MPVVRHEDEGAGKFEKGFLEDLERRDVEVVRRLVEDEQVGGLEHQAARARSAPVPRPTSRDTGVSSCSGRNKNRFAHDTT